MNLKQCILTRNDCYARGAKITPKGVMVHSTGANNPNIKRYVQPDDGALGTNSYGNDWNRSGLSVCVHSFIGKCANGEVSTYQTLPWDHRAWHCGADGNNTHISFEICEDDLSSETYFAQVYAEAVELTAYLCKEYNLDPLKDGVVIDHAEGYKRGIASGHADVGHWFPKYGKSMDTFRADVRKVLDGEEVIVMTMTKAELAALIDERVGGASYKTLEDVPEWGKETVKKLVDSGALQGTGDGLNISNDLLRTLVILDRCGVVK
ncbi:MAG: peptidoglycan recognition protein family protein [Oscillospiraceae bacterium]|jgi:hypothetical protein|nr:peptidoglycan recognition protein family protein [Oscillospiraceae bacterium]